MQWSLIIVVFHKKLIYLNIEALSVGSHLRNYTLMEKEKGNEKMILYQFFIFCCDCCRESCVFARSLGTCGWILIYSPPGSSRLVLEDISSWFLEDIFEPDLQHIMLNFSAHISYLTSWCIMVGALYIMIQYHCGSALQASATIYIFTQPNKKHKTNTHKNINKHKKMHKKYFNSFDFPIPILVDKVGHVVNNICIFLLVLFLVQEYQ